jgi:hypothetical protein
MAANVLYSGSTPFPPPVSSAAASTALMMKQAKKIYAGGIPMNANEVLYT